MNRHSLPALLLLVLFTAGAIAQTNEAPPAPAVTRDPFWPVGYVPPDPSLAASDTNATPAVEGEKPKAGLQIENLSEEQQAAIRRKLKVSGIMRFGPDYVARINNQLVSAGDELPVELEGQRLLFLVRSITKDSVQLEPSR
jgi:hypothetical protein